MKCPICGAKLVNKQLCPFCKITDEEIINASNKKVKEYRKTGNTDMIHMTNVIPSDLKRWKIVLYTILLGWLGVNYFYINRPKRAIFSLVTSISSITIIILDLFLEFQTYTGKLIYGIIFELLLYSMAINVVMWGSNVISVIFKTFKVPVVLATKEKIK